MIYPRKYIVTNNTPTYKNKSLGHASTRLLSFDRAIQRFCAFKLQFKLQRFALHSRSFP